MALCSLRSPVGFSSSLYGRGSKLEPRNRTARPPLVCRTSRRSLNSRGVPLLVGALPTVQQNSSPPTTSFSELIEALISGVDLPASVAEVSLDFLLNGADEALVSAFLVLLRAKGETYEEIVGLARAMIKHSLKVEGLVDVVDIVGTCGETL